MASALGLVQLKRCDQMALQRSIIAARYHGDFVVAEREYERYLSLPIFPGMTDAEIEAVISSVLAVVRMNLR